MSGSRAILRTLALILRAVGVIEADAAAVSAGDGRRQRRPCRADAAIRAVDGLERAGTA